MSDDYCHKDQVKETCFVSFFYFDVTVLFISGNSYHHIPIYVYMSVFDVLTAD